MVDCSVIRLRGNRKPFQSSEAIVEHYAHQSRHVIVASSRDTQPVGRARHKFVARRAGEHAQPFQHTGDVVPFQTVEAVPALHQYFDQARRSQAAQVGARCGGTHFGHYRKLGTGSRTAICQAIEHAGARWLTNGYRNSADCRVGCMLYIHTLIINEVFLSGNWHSAGIVCERGTISHDRYLLYPLPD